MGNKWKDQNCQVHGLYWHILKGRGQDDTSGKVHGGFYSLSKAENSDMSNYRDGPTIFTSKSIIISSIYQNLDEECNYTILCFTCWCVDLKNSRKQNVTL